MEVILTEFVSVTDQSSVGEARRAAMTMGQRLGFDETRGGELALLVTEVSRNVLVHGGGGQIILAGARNGDRSLARVLAMDSGPGIGDLTRAMRDGYSTGGTMGGGLGAIKRIATNFEIFTSSSGTIVFLEIGSGPACPLSIAGMAVPYPGERFCGDGWACECFADRTLVLLADGLGHGWGASEAAQEAITTFRRHTDKSPGAILGYLHDALRKTRGAVAAVAEIRSDGKLLYAGVGNISAVLLQNGVSRSLMSHNGTLGMVVPRIQELQFPWPQGGILILHSDGVQTRWDLASYAGLASRHPAVIAGALLRDFRRSRDDASVIVIKGL
ncbi:SpoIIE family protein phosphatase [Occallatibacter riparius]|uniref:SpoIIE family protein phosphatase n=1 Tax=Occallatibacter riparius TaxID=1002689 RepID=A0A9J7BWA6_9BACT|nr:SpoIIE family protein phosphatase [Occallatibacter riparius]UWZ86793.1 SpoIIE family protein phosphatase [Occallatibacter riparius]